MASSQQAAFVSFEGGEGSGKSSLVARLCEDLIKAEIPCHQTREPGGSKGAELIRELVVQGDAARWDAITEALLMYAARRDHVEKIIKPKLRDGVNVISDRFADSSLAYQGFGRGNTLAEVRKIHEAAIGDFAPTLTFVLDVDPEIALERANKRIEETAIKENRFEQNDMAFHQRVRSAFRDLASVFPERCVLVDASGDLDEIYAVIRKHLFHHLNWRW